MKSNNVSYYRIIVLVTDAIESYQFHQLMSSNAGQIVKQLHQIISLNENAKLNNII